MSSLPRRGTTHCESSGKPARVSRIAVRRPSLRERPLERASSMEQISNAAAYLSVPNAAQSKRSRSSSATPLRTPMRTPNRPIPQGAHGSGMATNERERPRLDDKKFMQAQLCRVNEYLDAKQTDIGLGKDFHQRGLKAMSTKQFIAIFSHLLRNIAGNRLTVGGNYVDDIVKALDQIGYPYTINKSWLKTPSAPHALNNVVMMFAWMLNFTGGAENSFEDFERAYVAETNDREFTLKFITSAKEGFTLWNNSRDLEFSRLKTDLINAYLMKENVACDLNELMRKTDEIGHNYKEQSRKKKMLHDELIQAQSECRQLEGQVKLREKELEKLIKVCENSEAQAIQVEESSAMKEKQIADTRSAIRKLETIVESQTMTTKDRDELINKIQYLKQYLDSKKQFISQLQDTSTSNQVQYSRLVQKTIETISHFNGYLYQIGEILDDYGHIGVQGLLLKTDCGDTIEEQLAKLRPILEKITNQASQQVEQCTQKLSELEARLRTSTYEFDTILQDRHKDIEARRADLERTIEELDKKILAANAHRVAETKRLQSALEEKIAGNIEAEQKIQSYKIEIQEREQENREMSRKVFERVDAFIAAKKRNLQVIKENVKEFFETLNNINRELAEMGLDPVDL